MQIYLFLSSEDGLLSIERFIACINLRKPSAIISWNTTSLLFSPPLFILAWVRDECWTFSFDLLCHLISLISPLFIICTAFEIISSLMLPDLCLTYDLIHPLCSVQWLSFFHFYKFNVLLFEICFFLLLLDPVLSLLLLFILFL